MLRCKKHKMDTTQCSRCTGIFNSIQVCENCGFKVGILETHGKRKGLNKTIRRNTRTHIKRKGNTFKRVAIRKVRAYFKGGSNGRKNS